MKKLVSIALLLVIVACLPLSACSFSHRNLQDVLDSNKIIIATNAEFKPFEYKDVATGELLGIDLDVIRAYANWLGVECSIYDMDFDSTFLSVYSGKADIAIAGITVNEKRQRNFLFTDAYYTSAQVAIVQKDSVYASATSEQQLRDLLSQNSANIGSQRGTIGEYYASGNDDWGFEEIPYTKSVTMDTGALACQDLSNGRLDAVIIDQAPANLLAKNYDNIVVLPIVLTEEQYAIAVQMGNESLVQSLNQFISQIKQNGTLEEIILKYYE